MIMSQTVHHLQQVLQNILRNKADVIGKRAQLPSTTVSDEAQSAIDLLLKTFGDPQAVLNVIGAQQQRKAIDAAVEEMDVAVAGIQVLLSSEELVNVVGHQLDATKANSSPLPSAAGGSSLAAASDTETKPVAHAASANDDQGIPSAGDPKDHGDVD